MTEGIIKTQGSHLFTIDSTGTAPVVMKFDCPTGITGLGGAKDQIEATCLDATEDKEYVSGLGTPGQVSVPFNFIPRSGSHQILFDWKKSGVVLPWLIGLSDGTEAPTIGNPNTTLAPPAAPKRTSIGFSAYVADVAIDIATNTLVTGTLTLQRSGAVTPYWNGPYAEAGS